MKKRKKNEITKSNEQTNRTIALTVFMIPRPKTIEIKRREKKT